MKKYLLFYIFILIFIVLTSCNSQIKDTTIKTNNTTPTREGAPENTKPLVSSSQLSETVILYDEKSFSTDTAKAANDITDAANQSSEYQIYINEVCSKTKGSTITVNGKHYDWIELYNPTQSTINLEGFGLTDKKSDPYRYIFPTINLDAGAYLLIFADSDTEAVSDYPTAHFGISEDGETLILTDPKGFTVDKVEVPKIASDTTYGRMPDGSNNLLNLYSTPGRSNNSAEVIKDMKAMAPIFSKESGFYKNNFELTLTAPNGVRIYYTTDGSIPTEQSMEFKASSTISVKDRSNDKNVISEVSQTTTGPFYAPSILIDKAIILRAVAYDNIGPCSEVITKTYFVGYDEKADYYTNFSVISLVTDSNNLFDYNDGIYVTGITYDNWRNGPSYNPTTKLWHQPANYKNQWERPAHIEYYDEDGVLGFSQDVGIRIRGGASRYYRQKSFNIYARTEYGDNRINYELFPDLTSEYDGDVIKTFKSFMLRNGGNDTELTKIREVLHHDLASELNISVQKSKPTILFLNGEFWGLYNLQEKYGTEYIESHYGVDQDDVIIVKRDSLDEGLKDDLSLYNSMLNYTVTNDLSVQDKYEEFSNMMDIDNFIDYICFEIYIGNKDWGGNNNMLWRSRTTNSDNPYADGKWRWMLYDTDYSTGITYENTMAFDARYNPSSYMDDTFYTITSQSHTIGKLFYSLIDNIDFRNKFKKRFLEIADTLFENKKLNKSINEYEEAYKPMMVDTLVRFCPLTKQEATEQFAYEVNKIRYFYNKRYDFIISRLNQLLP